MKAVKASVAAVVMGIAAMSASAAVVKETPLCGSSCTWSVSVDGNQVGSGSYAADPTTGNLTLWQPVTIDLGDGAFVRMNGVTGNIDPILGFSTAAGTGALGKTFAINYSMPIALNGALVANSSVSYSLTSLSAAGAQISPLFGKVVTAHEVDTTVGGAPALNKGVDVGNTFSFVGGPQTQNSPVYIASSTLTGNLMYDLMSVTLAFSLSPNSQVGISGFVQQEPAAGGGVGSVPVPAALWLLMSGLGAIGVIGRRDKHGNP